MRSVASLSLFVAAVGLSSAQSIQPTTVPLPIRDVWCTNQEASCPLLCLQQTKSASTRSNTCDPASLAWTCICTDGTQPNVSQYSQTVPFYECQEFGNQCVTNCGNDPTCQTNCRTQNPCGAQNPTRVNTTSASTMSQTASATGSGSSASSSSFSSFGGSGSGSNSGSGSGSSGSSGSSGKSGAPTMVSLGQSYGLAVIGLGLFMGFVVLL